jgi:hypothetical protein
MTLDARRTRNILIGTVLLAAAYLLAWALYWPAFGPLSGIQQPLHYTDSFVWPMAWTLHQAAPGVPDPAPLTLYPGDTAHQTFFAAADHMAALRVWLAGARGGEAVRVTLSEVAGGAFGDLPRSATILRLHESGQGRYYNLRFPPIARAEGREYRLDVQAVEGTVLARVGYVDPLPGRLYLNEYPSPGDLDLNAYHRGPPGLWTLRLLGRRLLPQTVRARLRQYKPAAFKGPVFGLLCILAALLAGAVLWVLAPVGPPPPGSRETVSRGRQVWVPAPYRTLFALLGLALAIGVAAGWRPAGMLLLGPKVALSSAAAPTPVTTGLASDLVVNDLVARMAFVSRDPEPRHLHARLETLDGERRAAIAVPAPSALSYGLRVPGDGELRLGLALPEGATQAVFFQVHVQGQALLERVLQPAQAGAWYDVVLDLRPYGGASPAGGGLAQVTLSARPADLPPALASPDEGPPSAGPLPVAALWAAPRVTSARSWLLAEPLAEPPAYPIEARFGGSGTPQAAAELLGADVEWLPAQGPHGAARVTLYWRALRPIYVPYTVFAHLLDGSGGLRGQWDSEPLGGTYPTDVWPAEGVDGRRVIRDRYLVPANSPLPHDAQLAIGLYDVTTRTRLPAFGADGVRLPDDRAVIGIDR